MADEGDESAWAFDVVGALKAKVDEVRESEAALRERARELEEERESLAAARSRLEEKEQALLRLDEEIARQREGVHDRQSDLDRAREMIAQGQERLAANEARLKEWAQSLHNAEQEVVALRDDLKGRHAEAAMKVAQFQDRLVAVMRREDEVADRESSLAESFEHLQKIAEAIVAREQALGSQVQALGDLQREWSASMHQREQEVASALAALGDQVVVESTGDSELTSLLEALHAEAGKLAGLRQSLVTRERKVMEFEQSLATLIGSVRAEVQTPVATISPLPEIPEKAVPPAQASPVEATVAKADPIPKTPKGRAMERMARALELAKKAQAVGRDTDEVRELVRQLRKAYEGKNWPELDACAQRALDVLALVIPSS